MLYLVQPRSFLEIAANFNGVVVDSTAISADGSFTFSKVPWSLEKTLFQICIQKVGSRFSTQLLDDEPPLANYMPVVVQNGAVLDLSAEADHFQATFSLKNPSPENLALLQLRDLRQQAYHQYSSFITASNSDEASLLEREAALQQFQQPLMAFADSSLLLFPALVAIRWISPSGDYERVPEFIVGQCQKWRDKMPDNLWALQLCQAGNREKLPVLVGDMLSNFALPMASGDTSFLYPLLGRQLTVVDIWASWCAPCRRENRETLVSLWAQYQNKGLHILGYSIDSEASAWKAAITKDNATWPQASHLSGDATPFLEALRITTIPANFILDGQGIVLAKNLHGEALTDFVKNYLK